MVSAPILFSRHIMAFKLHLCSIGVIMQPPGTEKSSEKVFEISINTCRLTRCLSTRPAICDAHAPLTGSNHPAGMVSSCAEISAVKPALGLPCASRPAVCDAHAPLTGSNHPAGLVRFLQIQKMRNDFSQVCEIS